MEFCAVVRDSKSDNPEASNLVLYALMKCYISTVENFSAYAKNLSRDYTILLSFPFSESSNTAYYLAYIRCSYSRRDWLYKYGVRYDDVRPLQRIYRSTKVQVCACVKLFSYEEK